MSEDLIRQTLEELKPLIASEEQQEALNYLAVNISGNVAGNLTVAQRIINHIDLPEDLRARFDDLLQTLEEQARFVPSVKRLFLSYAWADDQPFVQRLYHDLKAQGYVVWWDRTNLASRGLPILQELRDAIIDESDRIIPIVGPAALASVNVQYEWDTARQHCKLITPLLRLGDHDDLPPDFQDILYFDFRNDAQYEQKLAELLTALERPVRPPARLINVPSLPDHFLYRTDDMQAVEDMLLTDIKQPVVVSGKQQQVNVQGMGGIGKSVIAAALAHDCDIRRAFPDGIFWVQIGQSPDPVSLIGGLCHALSGINQDFKGNLEVAKTRLSELLTDRACLLILDDVWQREHARAFDVLGERSRSLLTTRIVDLVDDAPQYRLGVLSGDQAYALLRDWAGYDDQGFHTINDHLGGLPLALRLAGAPLKKGMAVDDWLARYDRVSRIKASRNARGRDESLQACFDLSVKAFAADGDDPLLYHLLGIFPEDVWVPEQVVLRLWMQAQPDLDDYDGIEIIEELGRLNLVERDRANYTIRLHDLLHDYNAEQLGERLTEWHAALLASYNPDQLPWHEIPDDAYLYDQLVYHLRAADRDEAVHILFDDDRWMHARFDQSGYTYTGFIHDIMIAWEEMAHPETLRQIEAGKEPTALTRCVHYALARTTINSLSANYIPELVTQAVRIGFWTPDRSLILARTIPNSEQRAAMYTALLSVDQIKGPKKEKCAEAALEAALESLEVDRSHSSSSQGQALIALAPKLEGDLLKRALEAAMSVEDQRRRVDILSALADELERENLSDEAIPIRKEVNRLLAKRTVIFRPSWSFDEIEGEKVSLPHTLDSVLAIEDESSRTKALIELIPKLEEKQLGQALEATLRIQDKYRCVKVLIELVPKLYGEEKSTALAHGLETAISLLETKKTPVGPFGSSISSPRAEALISLAPSLEGELLAAGLEAALAIKNEKFRTKALVAMSPNLEDEPLKLALETILTIQYKPDLTRALAVMANKLKGEWLMRALETALAIKDESLRINALTTLADKMGKEERRAMLSWVLEIALAIKDKSLRANTLIALAPKLRSKEQEAALAHGMEAALDIKDERRRVEMLAAFAPMLEGELLTIVVETALDIEDERARVKMFSALAPMLEGELLTIAVETALDIEDEWLRAELLNTFAPMLAGELLAHAFETALAIENESYRIKALVALIPKLGIEERFTALQIGLEAVKALPEIQKGIVDIHHKSPRVEALNILIPKLEGALLMNALDISLAIEDKRARSQAITALAPNLEGDKRTIALAHGLETALDIENKHDCTKALSALIPMLEGKLLEYALDATLSTEDGYEGEARRVEIIIALAPKLKDDLVLRALEIVLAFEDDSHCAEALSALVPNLSRPFLHIPPKRYS